jgi:adenosylhomocysteine nucleosidase
MEEEVVDLRARMVGARSASLRGERATLGWVGGARVALAVTGDGERNARRGLARLLAAYPVNRIIVVGVAGGLTATLDVGTLVIGSRAINEADGNVYSADAALVDVAATACGAERGIAVTAPRIADTVGEKRRLLALVLAATNLTEDHDPSRLPAVVDLESAAFAATATRADLPWVVLRAVSDTAADSLPALLNRSRDDGGAVRRGNVVRGLLTDPRALLPLLELRARVRTCARRLADAVEMTMLGLRAADAISVRDLRRSTGMALAAEQTAVQRKERREI